MLTKSRTEGIYLSISLARKNIYWAYKSCGPYLSSMAYFSAGRTDNLMSIYFHLICASELEIEDILNNRLTGDVLVSETIIWECNYRISSLFWNRNTKDHCHKPARQCLSFQNTSLFLLAVCVSLGDGISSTSILSDLSCILDSRLLCVLDNFGSVALYTSLMIIFHVQPWIR